RSETVQGVVRPRAVQAVAQAVDVVGADGAKVGESLVLEQFEVEVDLFDLLAELNQFGPVAQGRRQRLLPLRNIGGRRGSVGRDEPAAVFGGQADREAEPALGLEDRWAASPQGL